MFRSFTRILIVAGSCLAIAAPAAQAHPSGLTHRDGSWVAQAQANQVKERQADRAALGNRIVAEMAAASARQFGHRDTTKAESSFNYPDAIVGAAIAALLVGITVIALRRPQPRVTT